MEIVDFYSNFYAIIANYSTMQYCKTQYSNIPAGDWVIGAGGPLGQNP